MRWHEGKHDPWPYVNYVLHTMKAVYREFEEQVGTVTGMRGAKTMLIEQAIERLPVTFSIGDVERACHLVSRDMIRVVLNRLRSVGKLTCKGTGRSAAWEKRGNKDAKRANKGGNK